MPRRLFAFIAAFALAFAIAGCSSGGSSASSASGAASSSAETSASASAEASSTSALFSDLKWPENHVTEGVPVPEFSVAPNTIDDSELTVGGGWEGLQDQEVIDYVEKLKAAGFNVKASENKSTTSYSYSAQNAESSTDSTHIILTYTAKSDQNDSQLLIIVQRFN